MTETEPDDDWEQPITNNIYQSDTDRQTEDWNRAIQRNPEY